MVAMITYESWIPNYYVDIIQLKQILYISSFSYKSKMYTFTLIHISYRN